jgi:hypothetical protein
MNDNPITFALCDQPDEVVEYWYEKALHELVDSARLPHTEEVYESDKYEEIIFAHAHDLYENYRYSKAQQNG